MKNAIYFLLFIILGLNFPEMNAQVMTLNGAGLIEGGTTCSAGRYARSGSGAHERFEGDCLRFTANSFQNGAVWACDGINLNQSFKLNFSVNLGNLATGGDGMAFVLQRKGVPDVRGGRGGGIAYAQGDGGSCSPAEDCPISPSIAVEIDTWDNSADGINDITCDHIAIHRNGSMTAANTLAGPVCAIDGGTSLRDGADHDICITWDPSINELQVSVDGDLRVTYNGDIRTPFGLASSSVFWGFTGATGGARQTQRVCNAQMLTNIISPTCIIPLPVELISFEGKSDERFNKLTWETESELNNDFFTIEHSINGEDWQEINRVSGSGNTSSNRSYSYKHTSFVRNSINYYRLSQTDFDGTNKKLSIYSIDNRTDTQLLKTVNMLGQLVGSDYKGIVIDFYNDGTSIKRLQY